MGKRLRMSEKYPPENEENLSTWGLKHPERIMFDIPPDIARIFRRHCALKNHKIGEIVGNLITNYLIEQGEIEADREQPSYNFDD